MKSSKLANPGFKDLNVVYNEEINRRDGYWSSSSSDDSAGEESDTQTNVSNQKQQKLRSKTTAGVSKSEKVAPKKKDYRLDSKEQARQEWLWATGQLGVVESPVREPKPKIIPQVVSKKPSVPIEAPPTAEESFITQKNQPPTERVNAIPDQPSKDTTTNAAVPSPAQSEPKINETSPSSVTSPILSVPTKFYSLEYLEAEEYKKAEQKWDFEGPFNAELEQREAKRRAADRFYAQQQQPSVALPLEILEDMQTIATNAPNLLEHLSHQETQWRHKKATEDKFRRCIDALEALVASDQFVNKIQRFLQKHHRSLLSTKLMRDRGEYCHEDYAVYKAYVGEMEGIIMKTLRDAAEGRNLKQKNVTRKLPKASASAASKPTTRVINGVTVVISLEEDEDDEESPANGSTSEALDTVFDEEEFFDYLFSSGADDDDGAGGIEDDTRREILSFDAWEAILSVLHFNSFIDLVDEYVAAEYGIDDRDARGDTKTARRRGLPQQNYTPPPTPTSPEIGANKAMYSSASTTPVRAAPPENGPSASTPSPPKATTAVGSGAVMRRLVPSSTAKGFSNTTSTPTVAPRTNSLSKTAGAVPSRGPGSAPSSTARSLSKGKK